MENQDQNIKPITTVDKSKIVASLFVIIIFLGFAVMAISYTTKLKQFFQKPTPSPTVKPIEYGLKISTNKETKNNANLYYLILSPLKDNVSLSAFEISISGFNVSEKDVVLTKNKDLEKLAWQFPLSKIESIGEDSIIKFSGFRMGNTPNILKENLLLLTIEVPQNATIKIDIVNFYASDAITIIPTQIVNSD